MDGCEDGPKTGDGGNGQQLQQQQRPKPFPCFSSNADASAMRGSSRAAGDDGKAEEQTIHAESILVLQPAPGCALDTGSLHGHAGEAPHAERWASTRSELVECMKAKMSRVLEVVHLMDMVCPQLDIKNWVYARLENEVDLLDLFAPT